MSHAWKDPTIQRFARFVATICPRKTNTNYLHQILEEYVCVCVRMDIRANFIKMYTYMYISNKIQMQTSICLNVTFMEFSGKLQAANCESEHNLFKYYPLAVSVRNRLSKIYTGTEAIAIGVAKRSRSVSHIRR